MIKKLNNKDYAYPSEIAIVDKINEIIDHIQQEKEYHLNKGNVELKPTKEMLDIRSILEKTLIEAGQRRTIYNGCYLKLNLDTFKWFINQAEQKISSLIKKGKK
jgi:hypothetical protein